MISFVPGNIIFSEIYFIWYYYSHSSYLLIKLYDYFSYVFTFTLFLYIFAVCWRQQRVCSFFFVQADNLSIRGFGPITLDVIDVIRLNLLSCYCFSISSNFFFYLLDCVFFIFFLIIVVWIFYFNGALYFIHIFITTHMQITFYHKTF